MLWLAVILCLLVSFVFSGIEAGIFSVNRVRLRHRVKLRQPAAVRLEALLHEPERLLLTVVIVTNLMNIFAITLTTTAFVEWWGDIGYAVALLLFLPLCLFVLELLPKSLFRGFPYRALTFLSWPLRIAERLLSPVLRWEPGLAKKLLPSVSGEETRRLFAAREDFKYFTLESERTGAISELERQLVHNVVDFHSLTARELMRPLGGFPSVPHTTDVDALIALSEGGSIERFLVRSESGEIQGIVNLFDVLLDRGTRGHVSAFIRPLAIIPATDKGPRLLRRLRAARTPVALVMDGGAPIGLIFRETLYKQMISPQA